MPTVELQGTKWTFSPLSDKDKECAILAFGIENEYISYSQKLEIFHTEIEELLTACSRLLAGAFEREYSLSFDRLGLALDLYAYTENGNPVSRSLRREKDCVLAARTLMRSKDGQNFLGGVYTLLLHRKEIEVFVEKLRIEYGENCIQRVHGSGKYRFVGVSPMGYKGCNYLYLDDGTGVNSGEYAWVRMGRHNTEQIVYVDGVFYYDDPPYNPKRVKRILRKATTEEL